MAPIRLEEHLWNQICEYLRSSLQLTTLQSSCVADSIFCHSPLNLSCIFLTFHCRKFDDSLRSRNPAWGVRNLEDVVEAAEKQGLESVQNVEMPANNMSLLFRKP